MCSRVLERDFRLVEEPAADQDLAQVRTGERRLRRVAEALELVAGVRVVGRGVLRQRPSAYACTPRFISMTAADRAAPSSRKISSAFSS